MEIRYYKTGNNSYRIVGVEVFPISISWEEFHSRCIADGKSKNWKS